MRDVAKEAFRPVPGGFTGSKKLKEFLSTERKASMTSFNNEYRGHKISPGKSLSTNNCSSNISINNTI